jgi:phosphinothricin acetyltransferase
MLPGDWEAVAGIYAAGIAGGNATFETRVPSWEDWDRHHLPAPRLVAAGDRGVVGWIALMPVSRRQVYRGVVDVSIYVDPDARGAGVGRGLLTALLLAADAAGIWTIQAGVFPENSASLALFRGAGFRDVGRRERIGRLGDTWRDVLLLERRLA